MLASAACRSSISLFKGGLQVISVNIIESYSSHRDWNIGNYDAINPGDKSTTIE